MPHFCISGLSFPLAGQHTCFMILVVVQDPVASIIGPLPAFINFREIDDKNDLDLAVRRINVLARLPFHVLPRLTLQHLAN